MQRIHVTIRPLNREDSVLYFPPEAFGPFRVLHQIGAGTLGPVFRAYEPGRDRLVAVKVFRLDLTPEQASALVAELQKLVDADLTHPNIAAPIAAGMEHGAGFLAQEYAVGDSLDVILRERGLMPIRDVVSLIKSLSGAISYAADRGVQHGLLHPRDILIGADSAHITGFGIRSALSKIGAQVPVRPQYAPPDGVSDVYSLRAIAFEAVTGKRMTEENFNEFEREYGDVLRAAGPQDAIAPIGPIEPVAPVAPVLKPKAPTEPVVPAVAPAPVAHSPVAHAPVVPAPVVPAPVTPPPVAPVTPAPISADVPPLDPLDREFRSLRDEVDAPEFVTERSGRRWPIVAMFMAFAVFLAVAVGFFLQAPSPTTESDPSVDATSVDLPAPGSTSGAPTAPAEPAPAAPVAPKPVAPPPPRGAPAATPSRPASGAARPVQTGSVLIRSTPADADVLVDGKPRGKTPLMLRDLALGSYTIRVARAGYAPEERTLQLTAQRPTASTTIDLREVKTGPGGLNVQSRPAGARVFVNDRLAGSTPIEISGLPPGPATVRIELDNHQPWTTTVTVIAGQQTRVGASLEEK